MKGISSVLCAVGIADRCPTLIVPSHKEFLPLRGFDNAVCAIDLSAASEGLVGRVTSLIDRPEHRLTLLHVVRGSAGGSGSSSPEMLAKEYDRQVGKDALRRLQELIPAERQGTVLAVPARSAAVTEHDASRRAA